MTGQGGWFRRYPAGITTSGALALPVSSLRDMST